MGRLAAERLGDRAGLDREVGRGRVVVVVRVGDRVSQDHLGLDLPHDLGQLEEDLLAARQRVVALIEECHSGAEDAAGRFGLGPPDLLHPVQGHAGLFPGSR